MLRRLRAERYDYRCIHAVEEAAFPAIRIGQQHNIPVIYDMQSSMAEQLTKHVVFRSSAVQKRLRLLERWLIANANLVICSAGLEPQVRAIHPNAVVREWCFPSAIVPVSSAQRDSTRQELGIQPGTRVVLYAGNAEPYQGLSRIFGAMPKVLAEAPDTVFVLVGASSDRAQKVDAGGHLVLVPRRPKEMMPPYLAIADVLVAPRDPIGNLPLKLFDYMASGKPIVATDCETHRTVLNEDRALLVDPSADGFAGGILQLLRDRSVAERLGSGARRFAQDTLGWKAFVEFIDRAYIRAQHAACETIDENEH
jgi:glycosyltransferase involved in cell wall biosynthesis